MLHNIAMFFQNVFSNRVINAALVAWTLAQVLKVIIELARYKKLNMRRLFGAGGMPSSHSACICAVASVVCKLKGFDSVEFGLAAIFAFIVIFDVTSVRRAAGNHAQILNVMMQNEDKQTPELFGRELKEQLGHTPFQALMGILLGIAVGLVM